MVSVSRYAVGVVVLAVVAGAIGTSGVALRRRFIPEWSGPPARLAEAVASLALLIFMLESLGAVGMFRLKPIVAASLVMAGATRAAVGRRGVDARAAQVSGSASFSRPAAAVIAIAGAAAVAAQWIVPTLRSYDFGIVGLDSVWYHLPWAASFAQTGHITSLHFTDVEYLTAFYPATSEMVHSIGIVLLSRDTLSPMLNLGWLALTLLAAWCIGRTRGAAPAAMLAGALALALPAVQGSQAGSAANDIAGVFFLLAAVALLLTDGARQPATLVLAAVAAGLAVSVKLSLLAPVAALSLGVVAIAPARPGDSRNPPRHRHLVTGGLWCGPLLLSGGFWYARNLLAVGNPLPWISLGFLPTPHPGLQQHTGFSLAHYLGDGHVWSAVLAPGLAAGLGRWWVVIAAVAVLGPVLCVLGRLGRTGAGSPTDVSVRRTDRHMTIRPTDRLVAMLGVVALAATVAYLLTPETAAGPAGDPVGFVFNLRYAMPALALSLVIAPLAPALRGPRRQLAVVLGLAAVLVATLSDASLWAAGYTPVAVGVAALCTVVAVAGLTARLRRPRGAVAVAVAGAAVLGLAVAGYPGERHYLNVRYTDRPDISSLAPAWARFRSIHGARVGVAGTFGGFFTYPLYGLDLSNHVQYIAHRGPDGSFEPIVGCRAWRAAVNAGHYRYLLITPGRDPWRPRRLLRSPEFGWTVRDPAARLIYRRRVTGRSIALFVLRGPLDVNGCR